MVAELEPCLLTGEIRRFLDLRRSYKIHSDQQDKKIAVPMLRDLGGLRLFTIPINTSRIGTVSGIQGVLRFGMSLSRFLLSMPSFSGS